MGAVENQIEKLKNIAEQVVIPALDADINNITAIGMLDEVIDQLRLLEDKNKEAKKLRIALYGMRIHVYSQNKDMFGG